MFMNLQFYYMLPTPQHICIMQLLRQFLILGELTMLRLDGRRCFT